MKIFLEKHHKSLGIIGALVAFVIAIVYLKVVPDQLSNSEGVSKLIIVYGHSLCWFLLSAASLIWSVERKNKWSVFLSYFALITYIAFVISLLVAK